MKLNKKGFTLAELLIVVAIIAVLIAIAIPVFGAQLERARDSQSAANIRSAYAQAMVVSLDEASAKDTEVTIDSSATPHKYTVKDVKLDTSDTSLGNFAEDLRCTVAFSSGSWAPGKHTLTFQFTSGGDTVSIS